MIDRAEVGHRDQVLRAYFEGRHWDKNNEYALKRQLVLNSRELLPNYGFVIDDEWEVVPNQGQEGQGDLIFTDGAGAYAVVEVKWLDLLSCGKKASNKRTRKRKKVREQAVEYSHFLAQLIPDFSKIEGYCFTNEYCQPRLVQQIVP